MLNPSAKPPNDCSRELMVVHTVKLLRATSEGSFGSDSSDDTLLLSRACSSTGRVCLFGSLHGAPDRAMLRIDARLVDWSAVQSISPPLHSVSAFDHFIKPGAFLVHPRPFH